MATQSIHNKVKMLQQKLNNTDMSTLPKTVTPQQLCDWLQDNAPSIAYAVKQLHAIEVQNAGYTLFCVLLHPLMR